MAQLPLAINCYLHLADTPKQASDKFFPPYSQLMTRIGHERGWSPMDRRHFDYLCGPQGPLLIGSPQEIIDKLLYQYQLFNNTRFLAQLVIQGISHPSVLRSIELLGTQVAPAVRAAISSASYTIAAVPASA